MANENEILAGIILEPLDRRLKFRTLSLRDCGTVECKINWFDHAVIFIARRAGIRITTGQTSAFGAKSDRFRINSVTHSHCSGRRVGTDRLLFASREKECGYDQCEAEEFGNMLHDFQEKWVLGFIEQTLLTRKK